MTMYDKAGIPIIGRDDDDSRKKTNELSQQILMARGLINQLQEQLEIAKSRNINLLLFLFHLMEKTDNNRFRVSIKKLDSLRGDFFNGKFILKTYKDKAENLVIYREDVKKEEGKGSNNERKK